MKKNISINCFIGGSSILRRRLQSFPAEVKQLAMAHTSAHAEDASVTFFNPAGMSFIPSKLSVVAGGFAASNKVTFQNFNTLQKYRDR